MRVAADDLGAGNAGLRLLSQIHFDIVKIDLSLVQAGARRETSLDVLRSLAELAARWGAFVIAEGVEAAGQLRVLRELRIPAAQGYLLGRPGATTAGGILDLDAMSSPQADWPEAWAARTPWPGSVARGSVAQAAAPSNASIVSR
jgi:EAL domain-containing protein (putative c-di-GMP-specific phosphodiesterase class I)